MFGRTPAHTPTCVKNRFVHPFANGRSCVYVGYSVAYTQCGFSLGRPLRQSQLYTKSPAPGRTAGSGGFCQHFGESVSHWILSWSAKDSRWIWPEQANGE